jgi:exoribonuclease R
MLSTKDYKHFKILSEKGELQFEFEGAQLAGKALPGDFVRKIENGCALIKRTSHTPLVGIVHFDSKIKYGFTSRNVPIYLFTPMNESYPCFLVGSSLKERVNHLGVATFENWETTTFPRGSLQKILGPCGRESIEKEALAILYSPWIQKQKEIPLHLELPPKENRFILDVPTINIDPEDCRDIDDVISLWKDGSGWKCAISIADVAALYLQNPFMRFAEKIGQSLYQNGCLIRPLFNHKITYGMSLNPNEEHFAISLLFDWDGQQISNLEWKETLVTNKASYTYENCYTAKEIDIPILKEICKALGEDSEDSHKWIECLMLFYNTEAAKVLIHKGQGLLRAHSAPEREKLERYERLGLPAKELAFPAATYVPVGTPAKHWGLDKEVYCHASSPIRRFADLLNQIILKGNTLENTDLYCYKLNTLQKLAKQHDRDLFFLERIFQNQKKEVEGIVIGEKIYISEWKRFVRVNIKKQEGEKVNLRFYARMGERRWKDRIVFEEIN